MKNKYKFISLIAIIIALLCISTGCGKSQGKSAFILVSGDIKGFVKEIDISELNYENISYKKDGIIIYTKAFSFNDVFANIDMLNFVNNFLIINESDIAVLVNSSILNRYKILIDEGSINLYGNDVLEIKAVKELVVISQDENVSEGLYILSTENKQVKSIGNIRFMLYNLVEENDNNMNYQLKQENFSAFNITQNLKNIIYCNDYFISKELNNEGELLFKKGFLCYFYNNEYHNIFGIIVGVDTLIYDSFFDMQNALNNNNKIMFILPDGFGINQLEYYKNELSFFKNNECKISASTNPAISNVALASIITGVSPKGTGTFERNVRKPNVNDIFDYALSLNKKAFYIEGNGNLLITNIEQIYSITDAVTNSTDKNVFNNAMAKLVENPDLIFVHFHGIDDVNHENSPISNNSLEKIKEVESYIERLISEFNGDMIIIIPDHGHYTYFENNIKKGKHGNFSKDDMFVPYYIIYK